MIKNNKYLVVCLATIMTLSGCATQTFTIGSAIPPAQPTYENRQSFFISGLGQSQTMNAKELCGGDSSKIAKVEAEMTFVDGFLGFISMGLYTPRVARVFCYR